jgi:hypothetical protein
MIFDLAITRLRRPKKRNDLLVGNVDRRNLVVEQRMRRHAVLPRVPLHVEADAIAGASEEREQPRHLRVNLEVDMDICPE